MSSYRKDGSPAKCPKCGSADLSEQVKDAEVLVVCVACGTEVGFYAYGAWDPNFCRELEE
jgi:uncharacterized protein (DUF983 family)